jgi:hypothetical protein
MLKNGRLSQAKKEHKGIARTHAQPEQNIPA